MLFVFLSAMFGLVFSNNLVWILFFWEITTFCSFVLIGYSQTEEATSNAFLALSMNLLGGVAFAAALIYIASMDPSGRLLELNTLIYSGLVFAIIPAVLICFAGLTKAAQLPFSSWLLGAMVAPTPVSALLHSSTMVKAGVYIIVRFAPVLMGTTEGLMIALIGGITFLLASCMAISQSNAKRVLAYSTIGNLGLIVACAGVGTYNLMWVAILLMIFHAVAKSLLFLCVGTVENRIGSRDIEDMGGLIERMPKLAVMMFIGMAGMFLAPFGMIISKWAAIEAFTTAPFGLVFIVILAFGGSASLFFWCKWMGKILSVMRHQENVETGMSVEMGGPLHTHRACSHRCPDLPADLVDTHRAVRDAGLRGDDPARAGQHHDHAPDARPPDHHAVFHAVLPQGAADSPTVHGWDVHGRRHEVYRFHGYLPRPCALELLPEKLLR